MNLFGNVGGWEVVVILALAILVVGPQRVIEFVQSIRRLAGKLRGAAGQFTAMLNQGEEGTGQESTNGAEKEGESVQETLQESLSPIRSLQADLQAAARETREALQGFVSDELEPATGDLGAELRATAEQARQAMQDATEGKPPSEEG